VTGAPAYDRGRHVRMNSHKEIELNRAAPPAESIVRRHRIMERG